MKRLIYLIFWVFFLICLTNTSLYSKPMNLLSVNAVPLGTVPLGSSANLFKMGYGMELSASYMPASFKYFGAKLGSNFILLPLASTNSIWVLSGTVEPAFSLPIGDKLVLTAYGSAGYYYFNTVGWDAEY